MVKANKPSCNLLGKPLHIPVVQASQKAEETGRCGHHQSLELERAEGPEHFLGMGRNLSFPVFGKGEHPPALCI